VKRVYNEGVLALFSADLVYSISGWFETPFA
jgi:hypothetical protein